MDELTRVSRYRFVLITVLAVIAILYLARDFLMPIALAMLLTFLLAPLVDRLERLGINRTIAVIFTSAIGFAIVGALVYVVVSQFLDLLASLPSYRRQLRANLGQLGQLLQGGVSETSEAVEQLTEELKRAVPAGEEPERIPRVQVVEPAPGALLALRTSIAPAVQPIGTAVIVIVFTIFMLLRRSDLVERIIRLMGPRNLHAATEALHDAGARVGRYLLMQTFINGLQGVLVATGLALIGVPNAPLWGALTLVLRFIPYAGPWIAASMPVALSFAVADDWLMPLMTIGLLLLLEGFTNLVLEPWLYGSQTGVSPVALLVAATFWTWLWGLPGLFLAIPLTVCLVVIGKYIPPLAFLNVLLGDEPALAPHERYYQRLLARSAEEADEILEAMLAADGTLAACDQLVIPALRLIETDHERGVLDEERREYVLARMQDQADEAVDAGEQSRRALPDSQRTAGKVLVLPAADRADEVAATFFAGVLAAEGIGVRRSRHGALKAEMLELVVSAAPDVVVLAALPPGALLDARYLCKRLRASGSALPIVIGLWGAEGDLTRARERLESSGAGPITASCAETLEAVHQQLAPKAPQAAAAGSTDQSGEAEGLLASPGAVRYRSPPSTATGA